MGTVDTKKTLYVGDALLTYDTLCIKSIDQEVIFGLKSVNLNSLYYE